MSEISFVPTLVSFVVGPVAIGAVRLHGPFAVISKTIVENSVFAAVASDGQGRLIGEESSTVAVAVSPGEKRFTVCV